MRAAHTQGRWRMAMPARLAEIVEEFAGRAAPGGPAGLPRRVPPLPERLAGHRDAMEQVPERQTPFFPATELDDGDRVTIHFDAPRGADHPRVRTGILSGEGLNGATAAEVLAVPNGFYTALGLDRVISPLRLRGISAILAGSGARSASRSRPGRPGRRRRPDRVAALALAATNTPLSGSPGAAVDHDVAEAGPPAWPARAPRPRPRPGRRRRRPATRSGSAAR